MGRGCTLDLMQIRILSLASVLRPQSAPHEVQLGQLVLLMQLSQS